MKVCPKCKGAGHIHRPVAALGPIRASPYSIFTQEGYDSNYVHAGKVATCHVDYDCHVCEGEGRVPR